MAESLLHSTDSGAVDADNPWPGLAAFREADREFFYGREPETEELLRLVLRERLTVLFGLSGLGKSSLLQAGLFPRLREENVLPVYIRLDFSDSEGARRILTGQVRQAVIREAEAAHVEAPALPETETLWESFHRQGSAFWSPRNRPVTPLLVFDQFEEIFTLGRRNAVRAQETEAFLAELADLSEGSPPDAVRRRLDADPAQAREFSFGRHPYKILLSLREDFLPDLEGLRERLRGILHNRMRLRRMNGRNALNVISSAGGHLVEPDVPEQVVRFVAGRDSGDPTPLADLEIEPALLSVVCRELNLERSRRGLPRITAGLLAGNREEILADLYERSVADLAPEVRAFVEDRLLTPTGYRDSVALENALENPGITREALDLLTDRRLLRIEDRGGVQRIELTHDVLTGVIRKSRDSRWQRQEQEKAEAARREAEERERRARQKLRRSRITTALLAVMALGAVVLAYLAWSARSAAEQARSAAEQARRKAVAAEQATQDLLQQTELAKQRALRALDESRQARRGEQLAILRTQTALQEAKSAQLQEQATSSRLKVALAEGDSQEAARRAGNDQAYQSLAHLARAVRSRPDDDALRAQLLSLLLRRRWHLPLLEIRHRGNASVLHLTRDRRYMLSGVPAGSSRETFAVWDLTTGQIVGRFRPPQPPRFCLLSPDGRTAVTEVLTEIRLWNARTGEPIGSPLSKASAHTLAAFSQDGRLLAVVSGTEISLLSSQTARTIAPPLHHESQVEKLSLTPDGQILAAISGTSVHLWDTRTGQPIGKPLEHPEKPTLAQISPDGARLLTASGREARLWDARTGQPVGQPISQDWEVVAPQFSPDGGILAMTPPNEPVQLWNTRTGEQIRQITPGGSQAIWAVFSPDGRHLLTVDMEGAAQLWRVADGEPVGARLQQPSPIALVFFSPDSQRLLTEAQDQSLRVWDLRTQRAGEPMHAEKETITLLFSGDSRRVIAVTEDRAHVWDARATHAVPQLFRPMSSVHAATFSPDGARVAAVLHDRRVQVWDARTGIPSTLPMGEENADLLEFSPDGGRLLTLSPRQRALEIWDARTGKPAGTPIQVSEGTLAARFSRDGRNVETLEPTEKGTVLRTWSAGTGKPQGPARQLALHPAISRFLDIPKVLPGFHTLWAAWISAKGVEGGAFVQPWLRPAGGRFVSVEENKLQILDAATGKPVGASIHVPDTLHDVHLSVDGERLLVQMGNLTQSRMDLWDASKGTRIATLLDNLAGRAAFSPDGRRVVTASQDRKVRIWDARNGRPLSDPILQDQAVSSVELSRDGSRLLVVLGTGGVRIWDVPSGSAEEAAALADLAEVAGGYTLEESGLKPVANLPGLLTRLKRMPAVPAAVRWLLSDPWERTISPLSGVRVEEYLQGLLAERSPEIRRKSWQDFPGHPLVPRPQD